MSNESEVAERLKRLELNQIEILRQSQAHGKKLELHTSNQLVLNERLDVQRQMKVEQQNQLNLLEEHYLALQSQIEENQQRLDLLDKANLFNVENFDQRLNTLSEKVQNVDQLFDQNVSLHRHLEAQEKRLNASSERQDNLHERQNSLHEEYRLLLGALLAFRQLYDENALRAAPLRKRKPTLADRLDGFPTSKPKSPKTAKKATKKVSTPGKRS